MRAMAPMVGTHLPTRNASSTDSTPDQMNTSPATYFHAPGSGAKNVSNVVSAMMHSVPPIHSGFEIQYRTWFTPATIRPNASLVQTYGPPSIGKAAPNSDTSNPYGRKKSTASTTIQVSPSGPCAATEPIVSSPTSVQIKKNNTSNRWKSRRSRLRSTSQEPPSPGSPVGPDGVTVVLAAMA